MKLIILCLTLLVSFTCRADAVSSVPTILPHPGGIIKPIPIPRPHLPVTIEQAWILARSQVRGGFAGVYGESVSYNSATSNYVTFTFAENVSDEKILKTLRGVRVEFDVVGTNLIASAVLTDIEGYPLFTAAERAVLYPIDNGFRLSAPTLKLKIAGNVRKPYPNAVFGTLSKEDQFGNILSRQELQADREYLTIPVDLLSSEASPEVIVINVRVLDADGGYHEDTYRNGILIDPQHVTGTLTMTFPWKVDLGINPEHVRVSTSEEQPQFVVGFETTSPLLLPVYPSLGTIEGPSGGTVPVTAAYVGSLLDSKGNIISEFTIPRDGNPYTLFVPRAGTYNIILDTWDNPNFGVAHRENYPVDNGGGIGGGTAGGGGAR